jgi:hypothetical protein
VRVRPACLAAARATVPIFRAFRRLIIAIDFTSVRVYNNGAWGDGVEPSFRLLASNRVGSFPSRHGKPAYQGGFVDQQLKQLMKELGEAINESLADSEQIAEVVSRIKDGGYDIFLVLEATIGVSKPGEKTSDKTSLVTTLTSNPQLKISDQDLKFLKSLRIKIEDDAA